MIALHTIYTELPLHCRSVLQMGLVVLIQSTLVLVPGLLAIRAACRCAPVARRFLANTTLAGVLCGACLTFWLNGRVPPLWVTPPPSPPLPARSSLGEGSLFATLPTSLLPARSSLEEGSVLTPTPSFIMRGTRSLPGPTSLGGRGVEEKGLGDEGRTAAFQRAYAIQNPPAQVHRSPLPSEARAGRGGEGCAVSPRRWTLFFRTVFQRRLPLRPDRLYIILASIWLIGTLILLAWLILSNAAIWRLRRCSQRADAYVLTLLNELSAALRVRPPHLLASAGVRSPFLTGLWRPAIILPATYRADFDDQALRAVLAHELTHLAQYDCWWTLPARLLCALCWPQPLLWLLCRWREEASEEACDQAVLARACPPQAYARCLLALAERLHPLRPERMAGTGALGTRSMLSRRIERILANSRRPQLGLSRQLHLLVACLAAGIVMAAAFVAAAATPGQPSPQASSSSQSPASGLRQASGETGDVGSIRLPIREGDRPQALQTRILPSPSEERADRGGDGGGVAERRAQHERKLQSQARERALRQQLQQVEAQLAALQQRLAALQRQQQVHKPDEQESVQLQLLERELKALAAQHAEANRQLLDAQLKYTNGTPIIRSLQSELAAVEGQMARYQARIASDQVQLQLKRQTQHTQASARAQYQQALSLLRLQTLDVDLAALEQQRADLQIRLLEAQQKYTDGSPMLQNLQREMTALDARIAQLQNSVVTARVNREAAGTAVAAVKPTQTAPPPTPSPTNPTPGSSRNTTGLNLEFVDMPLTNVLKMIARQANIIIVMPGGDQHYRNVTLSLSNTPISEAMKQV